MTIWMLKRRGEFKTWNEGSVDESLIRDMDDLVRFRPLCFEDLGRAANAARELNAQSGLRWMASPVRLADANDDFFSEGFRFEELDDLGPIAAVFSHPLLRAGALAACAAACALVTVLAVG